MGMHGRNRYISAFLKETYLFGVLVKISDTGFISVHAYKCCDKSSTQFFFSSIKHVDSHNSQEGEDCGSDKRYQIQLKLESLGDRYSYVLCSEGLANK